MASERVYPAIGVQTAGGRILPTPAQFYLTGEDSLRVVSANSVAGVSIKIQCRTANLQGETVPHSFDHTPATNRSVTTQGFVIGAGSLLNVTVFVRSGAPLLGQTYVIIQLVRGTGAAAVVLGTLLAGYVTASNALGFPGSPILSSLESGGYTRAVLGTQPAAGAEITETVPTGARWEVIHLNLTLVTSATVATRKIRVFLQSIANVIGVCSPPGFATATQTNNFVFGLGWSEASRVYAAAIHQQSQLPAPSILLAGGLFRTVTEAIQAGDQWGQPFALVREWLEL